MKLGRFLGGILSIGVIVLAVGYDKVNSNTLGDAFALLSNNGTMTESNVYYEDSKLNENNTSNVNVIKYTNNNSYSVYLTSDNIKVNCTGSGANKEADEDLANRGFKIYAKFSNKQNGEKEDSIEVGKHETVYIYITSSYSLIEYPQNEVSCDYSVQIVST